MFFRHAQLEMFRDAKQVANHSVQDFLKEPEQFSKVVFERKYRGRRHN
jgi:hypothetical protein